MATCDQDEGYEKLLTAQLARVIDFLKFAEAKNGAMLAFCSAWLVAVSKAVTDDHTQAFVIIPLLLTVPPVLLVAVLTLISFLPRLPFRARRPVPGRPCDLLFFADVLHLNAADYSLLLRQRYYPEEGRFCRDEYFDDLVAQITANSRIAYHKYRMFNRSAMILIATVAVAVFSALALLALKPPFAG
ncbi:Pycsar system effector family protein [Oleisolibacter albus]|uniref:Pycsar system effector family protein n=1 Tax=Oleisolibacter albus TaxID=2171757 RepID=UPI000DF34885|nr:Pycsar system effector family protein [Oleisolibacter albus]